MQFCLLPKHGALFNCASFRAPWSHRGSLHAGCAVSCRLSVLVDLLGEQVKLPHVHSATPLGFILAFGTFNLANKTRSLSSALNTLRCSSAAVKPGQGLTVS